MSTKPEAAPPDGTTKAAGKKKLLLPLLLLLVLGGAGAGGWFSGIIPGLLGKGEAKEAGAPDKPADPHAAKPADPHGAKPADAHGAKPADAHGAKPADAHGAKPADAHGAKPADAHGAKPAQAAALPPGSPLFMDLPDIVANLNSGPRRPTFVKLRAKLELSNAEDQAVLTAAMPRVLDLFQGYLREMRPEELRGTAGTYRLREELLARTNLAAPPARVVAVLFTEMIVQ